MRKYILEQSPSEIYTSAAGLALVGQCLNKHKPLSKSARGLPRRRGIANIDWIRTCKPNVDGHAPIAAYLGRGGWCLASELRPGSQHAQKAFVSGSCRGPGPGPTRRCCCAATVPMLPRTTGAGA
jgi:hypothetical protein